MQFCQENCEMRTVESCRESSHRILTVLTSWTHMNVDEIVMEGCRAVKDENTTFSALFVFCGVVQ